MIERRQGIWIPGPGSFVPGEGNAQNLNAGIGGGGDGWATENTVGHGLCGDTMPRNGFTAASGVYGPSSARGTFISGGVMTVNVKLTAWHGGVSL